MLVSRQISFSRLRALLISKISTILLLAACLSACAGRTDYAPVSDVSTIEPLPKNGIYRVTAGETLYSIAWRYGLDYRDIAQRNHLKLPFHVQKGQVIYLTQNAPLQKQPSVKVLTRHTTPVLPPTRKKPLPLAPRIHEQEPNKIISFWRWPAHGQVIGTFSSTNKGINISGYSGDPIFATATGKVVYSGHGLRGYGNLIIIKHNSKFLSAYAHNKKVAVKEGDWVESGQKIAEMGNTGTTHTLLHFEIRRNGQPVNPLIYLTHKT